MAAECYRINLINKVTREVEHAADVSGKLAYQLWLLKNEPALFLKRESHRIEVIEIPEGSVIASKWWTP